MVFCWIWAPVKYVGQETSKQEFPVFQAGIPAYSRLQAAGASVGGHISAWIPGRKPEETRPLSTGIPAHDRPDLGFPAAPCCLQRTFGQPENPPQMYDIYTCKWS